MQHTNLQQITDQTPQPQQETVQEGQLANTLPPEVLPGNPDLSKQNILVDDKDKQKQDTSKRKQGKRAGRRKIKIEFIQDKSRRHITFSKRKGGIMKKAYELSTLTGTQVLLLVASETGHVYTFATPKLQPLITKTEGKNLIQACLNAPDNVDEEQQPSGETQFSAEPEDNQKRYTKKIKADIKPSHYTPQIPSNPQHQSMQQIPLSEYSPPPMSMRGMTSQAPSISSHQSSYPGFMSSMSQNLAQPFNQSFSPALANQLNLNMQANLTQQNPKIGSPLQNPLQGDQGGSIPLHLQFSNLNQILRQQQQGNVNLHDYK